MIPEPSYSDFLNQLLETTTVWSVVGMLIISAIATTIGGSIILLANQIRPWRLVGSLGIETSRFLVNSLVWILLSFYFAKMFLNSSIKFEFFIATVAIAFSPLSSAWWGLLPYFGKGIIRLLYFISYIFLFFLFMTLGFDDYVFILFPLGFVMSLLINSFIINPLASYVAGSRIVYSYKKLRSR